MVPLLSVALRLTLIVSSTFSTYGWQVYSSKSRGQGSSLTKIEQGKIRFLSLNEKCNYILSGFLLLSIYFSFVHPLEITHLKNDEFYKEVSVPPCAL